MIHPLATGYSGTPLAKKLGIKPDMRIMIVNKPDEYDTFFEDWPDGVDILAQGTKEIDLIHFFTKSAEELTQTLLILRSQIKQNGMIWVSWPKKASKVPTDVTEDVIRDFALANKLVDVKVCAVSEVWSGLKLVIPVKDRK